MFLRVVRRDDLEVFYDIFIYLFLNVCTSCLSDIIETLLEIRNYKNASQMLILSFW